MIKRMCLNNVIIVTTSIDESIVCMDTERSFVNVRRSSSTQFTLSLNEYHTELCLSFHFTLSIDTCHMKCIQLLDRY